MRSTRGESPERARQYITVFNVWAIGQYLPGFNLTTLSVRDKCITDGFTGARWKGGARRGSGPPRKENLRILNSINIT